MARSIGRPMRYFLAKQADGPCLIVAERMEELLRAAAEGRAGGPIPSVLHADGPGPSPGGDRPGRLPGPEPGLHAVPRPRAQQAEHGPGRDRQGLYRRAGRRVLAVARPHRSPRADRRAVLGGSRQRLACSWCCTTCCSQRGQAPTRLKAFTLAVDGQAADLAAVGRLSRISSI